MAKKKILIINGHPDKESFCFALAAAYKKGAGDTGAEVQEINIRDLQFDPNLQYGYRKRCELEPDLIKARELILWSEHMVWVHPVWWGSYPAIMKGFLDRAFLKGFAYAARENSVFYDKLLKGRSGRIICTMDMPTWYYRLAYSRPSIKALKKVTLEFTGVKKVRVSAFGSIRNSNVTIRSKWLDKIEQLGRSCN